MILKEDFGENSWLTDPWIYQWIVKKLKCTPLYNLRSILLSVACLDGLISVTIVQLIHYSILSQISLFDCWNWVNEL